MLSLDEARAYVVYLAADMPVRPYPRCIAFAKTWMQARDAAMIHLGLGQGDVQLCPVSFRNRILLPCVDVVWKDASENVCVTIVPDTEAAVFQVIRFAVAHSRRAAKKKKRRK